MASVILFTGGYGALGLKSASSMKWGSEGFLVRSRNKFADHDFMVAVVDTPSDQQQGMAPISLRGRSDNFLNLCLTPELAAEIRLDRNEITDNLGGRIHALETDVRSSMRYPTAIGAHADGSWCANYGNATNCGF